jgi:hypothetical protein
MCNKEGETIDHLLDECEFVSAIWEKGEEIFHQSSRIRGHPDLYVAN